MEPSNKTDIIVESSGPISAMEGDEEDMEDSEEVLMEAADDEDNVPQQASKQM